MQNELVFLPPNKAKARNVHHCLCKTKSNSTKLIAGHIIFINKGKRVIESLDSS